MRKLLLLLLLIPACAPGPDAPTPDAPAPDPVAPEAPDTTSLRIELGRAVPERPTAPIRLEGACPFECCTYGAWTTSATTNVYERAGDTTAVTFTVPAETELNAESGYVLLTRLGRAVMQAPVRMYRSFESFREAAPGDTVLLLDYVGEGAYNAWYADTLYQLDGSVAFGQPPGATMLEEPERQWWARVTTPDGRRGWLWMDRTPPVRGADACG